MARSGQVARVLLDTSLPQLDHLFDYRIPSLLAENISPGVKVSVPLRGGTRFSDALVIDVVDRPEFPGELQEIHKVISGLSILSPSTFELARTVADRQAGSVNDVLRLAIPPRYVRTEKAYIAGVEGREPVVAFETDVSMPVEYTDVVFDSEGRYVLDAYPSLHTLSSGVSVPLWAHVFAVSVARMLTLGKSSVCAVPDFRDIDHVVAACSDLGLDPFLMRVDAKQTGQERYLNYLRSGESSPVIIVGNRSAVYARAHNLGLIAVWDDGDHNFEEPLAPYAHARDVALIRQAQEQCALVLAGHTRSTEAQRLVDIGYATVVRPEGLTWPVVIPTDEDLDAEDGHGSRIPPKALLRAKEAVKSGPVLIQVASPGFSPALACATCRARARCSSCFGPLGFARKDAVASCRWCGQLASHWSCKDCGGNKIRPIGAGSERTAEELGRAFPGVRVVVSDGNHLVTRIDNSPALIIATAGAEPIPDGGYAAVLLLDGLKIRSRESLRVNEDALRSWSNAVCLAKPDAPIFLSGSGEALGRTMATWTQAEFAESELRDRLSLRLPPATRVVSISGPIKAVEEACSSVRERGGVTVMGPVGSGDGGAKALVTFDYKDGEFMATTLRAAIVTSASRSQKPVKRGESVGRVLRLRVRFDDPDIDSL